MAGKRLRLNVFGKLKIRSSLGVYRLKSATNAKLPNRCVQFDKTNETSFSNHISSHFFGL